MDFENLLTDSQSMLTNVAVPQDIQLSFMFLVQVKYIPKVAFLTTELICNHRNSWTDR